MKTTTIAVDVATAHLEIAVSNRAGRVTERHRLARARVLPFFRKQTSATVLLEACASAHHWARELHWRGCTTNCVIGYDMYPIRRRESWPSGRRIG